MDRWSGTRMDKFLARPPLLTGAPRDRFLLVPSRLRRGRYHRLTLTRSFCLNAATQRYHSLAAHRFPDHGESILPDFVIWANIVGALEIAFIYLFTGNKTVYFDRMIALYRDGIEFLVFDHDVFVLRILVAASFVGTVHHFARAVIH